MVVVMLWRLGLRVVLDLGVLVALWFGECGLEYLGNLDTSEG